MCDVVNTPRAPNWIILVLRGSRQQYYRIHAITLARSAIWCLSCCRSDASSSPWAKAGDEEDRLQSEGKEVLEGTEHALSDRKHSMGDSLSPAEGE